MDKIINNFKKINKKQVIIFIGCVLLIIVVVILFKKSKFGASVPGGFVNASGDVIYPGGGIVTDNAGKALSLTTVQQAAYLSFMNYDPNIKLFMSDDAAITPLPAYDGAAPLLLPGPMSYNAAVALLSPNYSPGGVYEENIKALSKQSLLSGICRALHALYRPACLTKTAAIVNSLGVITTPAVYWSPLTTTPPNTLPSSCNNIYPGIWWNMSLPNFPVVDSGGVANVARAGTNDYVPGLVWNGLLDLDTKHYIWTVVQQRDTAIGKRLDPKDSTYIGTVLGRA